MFRSEDDLKKVLDKKTAELRVRFFRDKESIKDKKWDDAIFGI